MPHQRDTQRTFFTVLDPSGDRCFGGSLGRAHKAGYHFAVTVTAQPGRSRSSSVGGGHAGPGRDLDPLCAAQGARSWVGLTCGADPEPLSVGFSHPVRGSQPEGSATPSESLI